MFTPDCHSGKAGWDQRFTVQEERGLHHVELKALGSAKLQCVWNIRLVLEAVVHRDAPGVIAQFLHDNTFLIRDIGNFLRYDRKYDDAFMQNLVVHQVVQQRMRCAPGAVCQEHGRSGYAHWRVLAQLL